MKILVLNCGSSSVKFAVFDMPGGTRLAAGSAEGLGTGRGTLVCRSEGRGTRSSGRRYKVSLDAPDHASSLGAVAALLAELDLSRDIEGVGHRVVHGGEKFAHSTVITSSVLDAIRGCVRLAPLHNPANLLGIEVAEKLFPRVPQVAVFDTAFHQSIPEVAYTYPVPRLLYREHGVRRYGFHGISHRYVVVRAAEILSKPLETCAFLSAHLGNGCSAAAVLGGKSVDTTMGLTPLEGLVMGTRSGTVDPGLHAYLHDVLGWDVQRIHRMLNEESGLLGISGLSPDMRVLEEAASRGDDSAALAVDVFCYRLAQSLAALAVALGRVDALIFTGGIGEHSATVRARTLERLALLGFAVDEAANLENGRSRDGLISLPASPPVLVVPTNEELLIAMDTAELLTPRKET